MNTTKKQPQTSSNQPEKTLQEDDYCQPIDIPLDKSDERWLFILLFGLGIPL
jgi:hypothetical protein